MGADEETLSKHDDGPAAARETAVGACLYLALACDRPTATAMRLPLAAVDVVELRRGGERATSRRAEAGRRVLRVELPDRRMSSNHARLARLAGRWVLEDAGSKNGTAVNGQNVGHIELADGDVIEVGHSFLVFREEVELPAGEGGEVDAAALAAPSPGLHTLVPELAHDFAALARVARADVAVVILGESGTGKEVVARAVHELSGRGGAFVAVNCGALPETLVETELFGYKKGAFSGATADRAGLVRSADGGTLFLDEIGDLPLSSQAPLLRVLQEREVQPVGATRPLPVDLRVVAATHRDLPALVEEGRFRADLWARLSGYTVELPPLRERREDLGLLCAALLRRRAGAQAEQVEITPRAARALFCHDWPLNVRELEQCLASALALTGEGAIGFEHLPPAVQSALAEAKATPAAAAGEEAAAPSAHDAELRERIVALLREHDGNVAAVARAMGKARMQVHRWMRRLKIVPSAFRG